LIAEAFYLTRDIEKYGSGFIRIRKEILSYPTMTTSYMESGDGFLVTLAYKHQKIASALSSPEGVNEGVTLLLEKIRKAPGKRIPQHSGDLGVHRKTIERWIALLKRKNLIEFRGSSRTGGYFAK
jgi:ATP-dependent DNA helicase RecG